MTDKFVSILASGTGGHVYPAYTIANEFIKQGYKIIWIGTKDGIENTVVKNKSITIKHISSTGIRGKSILKKGQLIDCYSPLGLNKNIFY